MKLLFAILAGIATLTYGGRVVYRLEYPPPSIPVIEPRVILRKPPNLSGLVYPDRMRPIKREFRDLPEMFYTEPTIDGLIDLFGSVENFEIAVAPEKVEFWRLKAENPEHNDTASYNEVSQVELSSVDAPLLSVLLTDDNSFNWEESYDCTPDFGFRVKFISGNKIVMVDLCFACHQLRVSRDGKSPGEINFEYCSADLAKLVDRYFPGALEPSQRVP